MHDKVTSHLNTYSEAIFFITNCTDNIWVKDVDSSSRGFTGSIGRGSPSIRRFNCSSTKIHFHSAASRPDSRRHRKDAVPLSSTQRNHLQSGAPLTHPPSLLLQTMGRKSRRRSPVHHTVTPRQGEINKLSAWRNDTFPHDLNSQMQLLCNCF